MCAGALADITEAFYSTTARFLNGRSGMFGKVGLITDAPVNIEAAMSNKASATPVALAYLASHSGFSLCKFALMGVCADAP